MNKIVRADQSPMNRMQWCCALDCGHDIWLTQTAKPTIGRSIECPKCPAKEGGKS